MFVVEDGTGKSDANSYASVEQYRAYHADRGTDLTGQTDPQIEGWLVQATDYVETRWYGRLKGHPLTQTQALHFPADGVFIGCYEVTGVPSQLVKAVSEYALRAKSGPLAPDPTVDPSGLTILGKTEKVGPLEESYTFQASISPGQARPYPAADRLMKPLLIGGGASRAIRN